MWNLQWITPSCPNLRNPFTFFSEKSYQTRNVHPISGDEKEGIFTELPFLNSKSTSNFPKNDFSDNYINKARFGQSPFINQSSKMFYQYQKPGQPPVKMVCYYNSNNGLGNYYICRGKGGDSSRSSYFQSPKNYAGVQNTLKNALTKNQGSAENSCFLKKNATSPPKTKFPGATSICKEDLSLITDTLSPIYDWAQQEHREVSDIDRYECLINLIDRLKCRIADEKNKYLASLSESTGSKLEKSVTDSQEINEKLKISSLSKPLDEQNVDGLRSVELGEGSPQTPTLTKKNEESKLFDLDPVQCENSDENLTCLKIIKRQVYNTKCDCGYPLKKNGRCPCGSWPSNQRRYYGI
ncbi:hypothetical protein LSTR_LSTR014340 [Laodelphax striatellus]|uniref:Uncharacterized protein n=1 Tax=Laodelphax striatellus TaxID=195883 RepID=A0A482WGP2_LAOST|nr:hypothetical protein LSTR_LSTR014340 [Laodelphax striatellus]